MPDLKSCPFCGGEAVIDIITCPVALEGEDATIKVVCLGCDAQTVTWLYAMWSEREATEAWNKRV